MNILWLLMIVLSLLFGAVNGTLPAVTAAMGTGAQEGVELCLAMAGTLCLWNGVMTVLRESSGMAWLEKGLRPVLVRIFPGTRQNEGAMTYLSANVSANLLGMGNAATPMGIQAAQAMARGAKGRATDDLCMLVVCNTASIQLIPTTVAAVRAAAGCANPFDILPAVWLASLCSVTAGIGAARLGAKLWRD